MAENSDGSAFQGLEVLDWGRLNYGEAFERQKAWVQERIAGSVHDRLVLVEHPPVVTIGRSGGPEDLRVPETALRQKGVDLYRVDRGGMATFHGPGQLVAYPILKLERRDLHLYLEMLQNTIASVLRTYGLTPTLKEGRPGVWTGFAKVASIGIAVRKWVTYHGVALNVNTDPDWFTWIVPCGHSHEKVTSMERELGRPLDLAEVKKRFVAEFCKAFGYGTKHPPWLVRPAPSMEAIDRMEEKLCRLQLATVCQSAHCPNLGECFERGTATFMILGTRCTRRCRFCAVENDTPEDVDPEEPARVARAAQNLGLRYVVITSVTRDDLPDGGALQFTRAMNELRKECSGIKIEVLIPDFQGSLKALQAICDARPDVLNHNLETVARLYPMVRPRAKYRRSLGVLEHAARMGLHTKSGLMLGLGETESEIRDAFADLRRAGCMNLTLGQYLAPSKDHIPVARFVPPEEFDRWAETARSMGFKGVAAGPLVRSSYRAEEMFSDPVKERNQIADFAGLPSPA